MTAQMVGANPATIRSTVEDLLRILADCDGWGYDTYDTRIGPVYLWLYRRRNSNRFAELAMRSLYAVELLAPITFRRIRGIRPTWDPMGNSYRAGAHLALAGIEDREAHLKAARTILDAVVAKAVGEPGFRGFALGFPCITGSYKIWPTNIPVSHYTLRVARMLLRYEQAARDGRYRTMLDENIRFLCDKLPWVEHGGMLGVGYHPGDPLQVINIWADVASVLASYDQTFAIDTHHTQAVRLAQSVLAHQLPDGTWPYFASWQRPPGGVDNTHTAMVLGALADLALCYPVALRTCVRASLEQGTVKWIEMFFAESSGRFWNSIDHRADAYTVCLGDAIYANLRLTDPALELSATLVNRLKTLSATIISWSLQHLKLSTGRFCERRLGSWRFSVQSVRSFDGLVADSLALYWATNRSGSAKNHNLWTAHP